MKLCCATIHGNSIDDARCAPKLRNSKLQPSFGVMELRSPSCSQNCRYSLEHVSRIANDPFPQHDGQLLIADVHVGEAQNNKCRDNRHLHAFRHGCYNTSYTVSGLQSSSVGSNISYPRPVNAACVHFSLVGHSKNFHGYQARVFLCPQFFPTAR